MPIQRAPKQLRHRCMKPPTSLPCSMSSSHSPSLSLSVSLFSQVENPSQFIQGYRVLFRQTSGLPSPGPWQIQDLKVASERDVTLSGLKKGIVYEIKVRPYFNEFQGADSESMTARTMEEGKRQMNSHSQKKSISQLTLCCKKCKIQLLMHERTLLCK